MQLIYEIILLNKVERNTSFPKICNEIMHHSLSHFFMSCECKNVVKPLATRQTRQFQLFSTDLPSNFSKITRLLGTIKTTVSLRFKSSSFPSKKLSSERTCPLILVMNSLYSEKGQWSVPVVQRKNIHAVFCEDNYFPKGKLKWFKFISLNGVPFFSIAILFAVRYLWDVRNEDKCCVVTYHAADFRVAWLVYLA